MPSPFSKLTICARIPHNATKLPNTTTVVAGSAITITDSTIDTHQEIIELVEVPAAISVRANEVRAGAPPGRTLLTLANGTDLRSAAFAAMFEMAAESWGRSLPLLRYDVDSETNWNGPAALGAATLPPEMLPFSASPRIVVTEAPAQGVWGQGALVWAAVPTLKLAGWLCVACCVYVQWWVSAARAVSYIADACVRLRFAAREETATPTDKLDIKQ